MSRSNLVPLACVAIFSMALGACLPERSVVLGPDDEILDDFIDEYYRERFSFYPSQSTAAGFPGHDDEVERFDEESIGARIAWLADFRLRLIAVRVEELSRFAHPESLWLRSEVEAELWQLEQWASWRHQADFYLRPARVGLRSLLIHSPSEMVSPLLGRLEGFAVVCRAAGENLVSASPAERESGLEAVRRSEAFVIELLNRVLPDVRDHERHELQASRDAVLKELRALRTVLQELPAPETRRALGETAFRKYWIYSAMVDLSTTEMEMMAESAIARLRGEIDDLMLFHFPGETPEAVVSELSRRPAPTEVVAEVSKLAESLSAIESPLGRIRIEAMTRVELAADAIVAPRVVRVLNPPPLEPIAEGLALVATERSRTAAGWVRASSEAVYQLVGHAVQNEYRSRSMSLLRKAGSARTSREGWALLVRHRMLTEPALGGGEVGWPAPMRHEGYETLGQVFRLVVLRETLVEHVRLLASIRFHRDRIDDAAIRELFLRTSYLTASDIDSEWRRVQLDPGVGSAAMGMMLLERLERDFQRKFPAAGTETFYEKFLQAGVLPIRLIRLRLLGETGDIEQPLGFRPRSSSVGSD